MCYKKNLAEGLMAHPQVRDALVKKPEQQQTVTSKQSAPSERQQSLRDLPMTRASRVGGQRRSFLNG